MEIKNQFGEKIDPATLSGKAVFFSLEGNELIVTDVVDPKFSNQGLNTNEEATDNKEEI
jgi:hypothetical protein